MKQHSSIRALTRHKKNAHHTPGTLHFTGEKKVHTATISQVSFNAQVVETSEHTTMATVHINPDHITWLHVSGVHDTALIESIGSAFALHPLLLEDIVHPSQRPKIDVYDAIVFIVLHALHTEDEHAIVSEQISMVCGDKLVITFSESEKNMFEHIVESIVHNKGKVRSMGSDFLSYLLLDAVVDQYFVLFDTIGEQLELMEIDLIERPNQATLHAIYHIKRDMIFLRKSIWPLREVVAFLLRDSVPFMQEHTIRYLQDLYDHTIQVIDIVDSYRDILSGMLDNYLSSMSNHMNAIMKVLTMFTAIFIPLTFIAGLYGMNFKYMPELEWKYGYAFAWSMMGILTIGMIIYFKKKKWL